MLLNTSLQTNPLPCSGLATEILPSRSAANDLDVIFNRVSGEVFRQEIQVLQATKPDCQEALELLDDYSDVDCWIAGDGLAGFAVTPQNELINVFSRVSGLGTQAVLVAQQNHNNLNLNCFDGSLVDFYKKQGFEEVHREENWYTTPARTLPEVVYMAWERK